jgi:hypothetical protein
VIGTSRVRADASIGDDPRHWSGFRRHYVIPRGSTVVVTPSGSAVVALCRSALRDFAPFGISRRLNFALFVDAPLREDGDSSTAFAFGSLRSE